MADAKKIALPKDALPSERSAFKNYLTKMNPAAKCPAVAPPLAEQLWTFGGAFIAIGIICYLTYLQGIPILIAPFGASAVLIFGVPASPFSQPRNVLGGHILAALIGVGVYQFLGGYWFAAALSVALTMVAMFAAKMVHPPAGATAIIAVVGTQNWLFALFPVTIGALILILVSLLFNNLAAKRSYPSYWW
ncbi:MAG: HPP family protein [Sporomusaceae bacterium]|jgi:CBS-domain-containing membrane protein|nr:HPP family protein [Sporomusaceae bacterium]